MKNQRVIVLFYSDSNRSMLQEVHYSGRALSEKDFKRFYNHICKKVQSVLDVADVFACYDDESGEIHELAQWWGNEEMTHNPVYPF